MDILRVRRFKVQYRLQPERLPERERLDGLLRGILAETLEQSLERAGVSPHEEVCIRKLHVPVRLRLNAADSSLVMAWTLALTEAIVRARDGRYVPGVVRYTSRVHALLDLALGVLSGNYERSWAWRLTGVWTGSEAPGRTEAVYELVQALKREPGAIAPVLTVLAAQTSPAAPFAQFAEGLLPEQWTELAQAALAVAGGAPDWLDGLETPGVAEVMTQARRILTEAPLGRTIAGMHPACFATVEVRRALAALLVLSHDPGALQSPARGRALVSALADAIHPAALPLSAPPAFRRPYTEAPRSRKTPAGPESSHEIEEAAVIAVHRSAATRFGGLLFLLGVVDDLRLPEEILARFPQRPFRWVLHQLGLALVPAAADDPAVLAFAGLLPDAVPPSRDEEPPTEAELEIIASCAGRIEAALGELLEGRRLINFVCHRSAQISADPGWIEVRLSLKDVCTEIRRAGLDLDPGYVPWLGVVVRFIYE
jgi:hypothetical protein